MLTKQPNRQKQYEIKVIDSMMGAGKTSYAIELMNEADPMTKFIYVTPYLEEVERIQNSVTTRTFKTPDKQHGLGTKYNSFKRLVAQGENIVTTHALFSRANDELLEWLRMEDYVLIIDEVMDVINTVPLRKNDIDTLLKSGLIEIAQDSRVIWKASKEHDSLYNGLKDLALSENLYYVNNVAFIWNFPVKIFKEFSEVYILTYLFDGQLQKYYYDLHGLTYQYYAVENGKLVDRSQYREDRTVLKQLISIYDGKLNLIGDKHNALSKSWFQNKKNAEHVKKLKNNLYNYFRQIAKAKSDTILWTTFKDYENKLKGNGYSKDGNSEKCFTPWNLRATNKYGHKTALAYCLNRYMNPVEAQFFKQHNVEVNEELLALSDLLQWVFRSAVRKNRPIQLYIPSSRMRELLINWLNEEIKFSLF